MESLHIHAQAEMIIIGLYNTYVINLQYKYKESVHKHKYQSDNTEFLKIMS